ncbi:MAG: lipopolysaccharide assembly protein LapB [Wenzhouxiangella sp.]|nr:MAG: lipopolysaccharide assembly protein LapB [Wenzhouxiangella sp.]
MLELFLLFTLLPVAAASGWWAARHRESGRRKRDSVLSSNYFRGLNYLLNEQPDKAIEVFLEIAEINQDTVETHLALGNLFRRRGEMDKAIRFHKHIISRPNLTDEQRSQALLELGEDYMRAGLLDRAEKLFAQLLEHNPRAQQPARQLLGIYQQEKDWARAIERSRHLADDSPRTQQLVAQFYCELAQQALDGGDPESVRKHLRQARSCDPRNPRPRLLEGELWWRERRWQDALDCYLEACRLDRDCVVQALDRIVACHRQLDQIGSLEAWLVAEVEEGKLTTPALVLAELRAERDPRLAVDFLLDYLSRRPTVRGLECLMHLLHDHDFGLEQIGPELIRDLMLRLIEGQPVYRCNHCGFSGSAYHWLCPSCRRWNTTRVISGVLGE